MSNVVGGAVVVSECPDLTEVSFEGLPHVEVPDSVLAFMIGQPGRDQQEQQRSTDQRPTDR